MAFDMQQVDFVAPEPMRAEYLPHGEHTLLVRHAEFVRREDHVGVVTTCEVLPPSPAAGSLVSMLLMVYDEWTASRAMRNLIAMGLEGVEEWSPAGAFSVEFPKCAARLIGKAFVVHKRLVVKPTGQVKHQVNPMRPAAPPGPKKNG